MLALLLELEEASDFGLVLAFNLFKPSFMKL